MYLSIESTPGPCGTFNHDALREAYQIHNKNVQVYIRDLWGWEPILHIPVWNETRQFRLVVKKPPDRVEVGTIAHAQTSDYISGQTTLVGAVTGLINVMAQNK